MSIETLWIPTVGEWILVPSGLTPAVMVVTRRVRRSGEIFIQCGEYLFPLEHCQKPEWLPQAGDRVRAKICRYEGTVHGLFIHEQGYVMADCRMYRQENGKPVPPDFRIWTSPVAFLEPVRRGNYG